jgi:hypothetical protein
MTAIVWAGLLFFGILVLLEAGRLIGRRRLDADPESGRVGAGVLEGAVFGLFGLLVAFTFSGAGSRFDMRRQLAVQEANDIGTAWLRLAMLPEESQFALRDLFRRYLDSRLKAYRLLPDVEAARGELSRATALQEKIWIQSIAACRSAGSPQTMTLLLPALNQMIDITTTRTMATEMHPPTIIFIMLTVLSLAVALLAGSGMGATRTRSWMPIFVFASVISVTIYVIRDIEYPRLGLIRVDEVDRALVDLRESLDR